MNNIMVMIDESRLTEIMMQAAKAGAFEALQQLNEAAAPQRYNKKEAAQFLKIGYRRLNSLILAKKIKVDPDKLIPRSELIKFTSLLDNNNPPKN